MCDLIVLVLIPLALAVSIVFIWPISGLVALGIIVVTLGLFFGLGVHLTGVHYETCPGCNAKSLKCIDFFHGHLQGNLSFYRCQECGAEYVKGNGVEMVKRDNSPYKNLPFWDAD